MTTINLKDFYPWYTQDEYMEVSDEVAEELRANKRYEAAYRRRVTRNKAQYSLDCDDGIEYSACVFEPSPEELVLREGTAWKCCVIRIEFPLRKAGTTGGGPYSRWKEAHTEVGRGGGRTLVTSRAAIPY